MLNSSRFAVALALSMVACAALAAEQPAGLHVHEGWTTVAASSSVAPDTTNTHLPVAKGRGTSAGVAATLPDDLDIPIPGTQMPFYLIHVSLLELEHALDAGCVSVDEPSCDAPR